LTARNKRQVPNLAANKEGRSAGLSSGARFDGDKICGCMETSKEGNLAGNSVMQFPVAFMFTTINYALYSQVCSESRMQPVVAELLPCCYQHSWACAAFHEKNLSRLT